ncbi:class I SAM-dependent DNA methyltransferase [Nocardiopsis lambiniae]|uniref:Class I SAM-dependent methyltransferase n=1 Tax=Nocardiopsis lambiniae TaxID=3075539 RepID=A0ABU2M562_9ACTN|nr:class I SAM-dependent methyltransferase [Nocardiopsis sp. DSM 44743]MDT0327767.1 class I SAM-dependent methyltransferase [Nocardiopsis sp. DSM 44743]
MTESTHLDRTRAAYDTVAADYAEIARDDLDDKPLDRALLAAFAERVRAGTGEVADLGCGPGRITAFLRSLGVEAFGVDLSPGMISVARREHPDLRFEVGSMTALDLVDGSLAGAVAWYSTVHTPPDLLPTVFAEIHRVLAPGGHLVIAFKAGDELRHLTHAYGHDLSLDVHWTPPERIADLLTGVGLVVNARLIRDPEESERSYAGRQAFLLAHRPGES